MPRSAIEQEYFEWMFHLVCVGRFANKNTFRKLLSFLHDVEFTYSIPKDSNRADDGIELRYRYAYVNDLDVDDVLNNIVGPCSVFEMILALAIRCEETIMDDPLLGDRTGQWFWKMIANLGLGSMSDARFDRDRVEYVIARFLNRDYEADGRGGLFRIRNCKYDLRNIEIWTQMLYFLDSIS